MKSKSLKLQIQKIFWVVPFIFFLLGYYSLHILYKPKTLAMPHLVDKSVLEALKLLGPEKINIRLINQKEDVHKPDGTILEQMPTAGQMIKPHQTVFLVISQQTSAIKAPDCKTKTYTTMMEWLKDNNVPYQLFFLKSKQPSLSFIGQIPQPNEPLNQEGITLYYSAPTDQDPVIMPTLVGLSVEAVEQFLAPYQIKPTLFHEATMAKNHDCSNCIVKEQRPLPGALVVVKKSLAIQLKI